MDENRLRTGGPDAPERASDSDWVGRAGKVAERYKILWIMLAAILAWWGRNVVTPLRESAMTTSEVRLINRKIDSVLVPRLDLADVDRSRMLRIQENQSAILGTLTRLQCLRTSFVDRAKINLDCASIPVEFPKTPGGK